ncbi:MAG: MBOAT family O-acyltransferase [Adlercreutzia sp.]
MFADYTLRRYGDCWRRCSYPAVDATSRTMDVALGMSRIFGISLPENFRQPFFSRTASGFWQRWHITLGTWLRDYIYYPVSLSKPMKKLTSKARKRFGNRYGPLLASSAALLCVWLGNGLWHGAGSQYIFFGMYYFVLIVAGSLIDPTAARLAERLHISRESVGYRAFQIARTLVIIVVGELFFRAEGLDAGLAMCGAMFTDFVPATLTDGTLLGIVSSGISMDMHDFGVVIAFTALLLVVDILRERGIAIPTRWARGRSRHAGPWYALFAAVIFGLRHGLRSRGSDVRPVLMRRRGASEAVLRRGRPWSALLR